LTFLTNERTRESFETRIPSQKHGSQRGFQTVFNNFDRFCKEKHDRKMNEVVSEMVLVKETNEDAIWDTIQGWINWNVKEGNQSTSIRMWFSRLNKFLYYMGIKLDARDIKFNLDFPKKVKEEKYPLKLEEIQKIFLDRKKATLRGQVLIS